MTLSRSAAVENTLALCRVINERADRAPLEWIRWLPLQRQFLLDPYPLKQIRAGNQTIGKSIAMFALLVGHCLGRHPLGAEGYPMPKPPVYWWLVLASFKSVEIQRKLWELLPKDELDPRTEFDAARGFRPANAPVVRFKNGSIIRIRTGNQEALDFAGATIDGLAWDEPPRSPRLFTEGLQRVEELGGRVLLAYTPVNAVVDYLRELCDAGTVHDHWAPLTPDQLIPVGGTEPLRTKDGRVKDAAWIEDRLRGVPAHERPVVVHGEWEMRAVDRYFTTFRDGGGDSHVHDRLPKSDVDLVLGLDHGSRPGKQVAILIAVWKDRPTDRSWRLYVLDEYTDASGRATPYDDARGILKMLGRNSVKWSDLSFVGGDKVHEPGRAQQKSNRDLAAHVARELVVPQDQLYPPIRTIKRGAGRGALSVGVRSRWLYHRLCEPGGFGVHSRCTRVREALHRYDLRDNEYKDPVDAIVYGLDPYIFGGGLPPKPARIQFG